MAAEQAKTQRDMQTKQMDIAQKERDSQRDYNAKLYQIDADTRVKLHQTHMAHEGGLVLESHKALIAHNSPEAEQKRQEAQQTQENDVKAEQMLKSFIEHSKAQQQAHQEHTSQLMGQMMEAVKQLSAPKKVVRDKAGRITHTEPMRIQ